VAGETLVIVFRHQGMDAVDGIAGPAESRRIEFTDDDRPKPGNAGFGAAQAAQLKTFGVEFQEIEALKPDVFGKLVEGRNGDDVMPELVTIGEVGFPAQMGNPKSTAPDFLIGMLSS